MKYLSRATGAKWVDLLTSDGVETDFYIKALYMLSSIVLSENLIVLCGPGFIEYIKDSDGKNIFPDNNSLWEGVKNKAGNKFANIQKLVHYKTPANGKESIGLLIDKCRISEELNPNPEISSFLMEAGQAIAEQYETIKDFITPEIHEAFLRKVICRSTRLPRTKIFTTTHDLLIETAASRNGFTVIDGFTYSYPHLFDKSCFNLDIVLRVGDREFPQFISNTFHLYKLHGSVDWEAHNGHIVKNSSTSKPLITFCRPSYSQPFIEMTMRFQTALRQQNTGLILLGFDYNDSHLIEPIMAAIRSNLTMKCMIVDKNFSVKSTNPAIKELSRLIVAGDPRLTMMQADAESFVDIFPGIISDTEEDLHFGRIHKNEA